MPTVARRLMQLRGTLAPVVLAVVLPLTALTACSSDPEPVATPSATPTPTPVNDPAKLTLGVWGAPAEIAAYDEVVRMYNASTDAADVTLASWPDDPAMTAALAAGEPVPDVFLVSRGDMQQLRADDRVSPVDDYLDARAVDLGDEYSRQALEAFSAEGRLLCMPYGVSPRVIFYNTDLVDFPRMEATGLEVPTSEDHRSWSMEQFVTAATFATTVRPGVKGFAIDPTLKGLAPFVLAAGGKIADDEEDPSALAFADEDTREALETLLPTLRNAEISLSPDELGAGTALGRFKRGRLGMFVGDRSLVPELRAVPGLRWDVMPIPSIDGAATIGDYTALCISRESERLESAADLLVSLVSEPLIKPVAATGYLVPVNQRVALSEDFLQPTLQPLHSQVFVNSVRNMQILPFTHQWSALEAAAATPLRQLFTAGPTVDVDAITEQIDAAAETVLGPPEE